MTDPAQLEPVDRALRYAALSGPFDPRVAIEWASPADMSARLEVAAVLADKCTTGLPGDRWILSAPERQRILHRLTRDESLSDDLVWREQAPNFDQAARDLVRAISGELPLSDDQVPLEPRPGSGHRTFYKRAYVALSLAGPLAPRFEERENIGALLEIELQDELDEILLRYGCLGRDKEIADLLDFIAHPPARPTTYFLAAAGGMGKSTLLAQTVREARDKLSPIVVRLDFDRPSIDPLDRTALSIEAVRQVAAGLPQSGGALRRARLETATQEGSNARGRGLNWLDLLRSASDSIKLSGRTVLVVLDTFESLASRGESHPVELFRWLDECARVGWSPMAVIAAGRGDPPAVTKERFVRRHLREMPAEALMLLASRLEVPEQKRAAIVAMATGSPLKLRMAASLAEDFDGPELDAKLDEGQLYRMLLSRLHDEDLRRLAHPGLLVRRMNAELIRFVLAPALGMKIGPTRADELWQQLALHAWMVKREGGWLQQRQELRELVLESQLAADPPLAAQINRRAADWFARRPEPWARAEALYHRLQATRGNAAMPALDEAVFGLDAAMISELPEAARNRVLVARGQRSELGRSEGSVRSAAQTDASAPQPDWQAAELSQLLERRDLGEAERLVDAGYARDIDPIGHEADVLAEFLFLSGRWTEGRRLLRRRDEMGASTLLPADPSLALALLRLQIEVRSQHFDVESLVGQSQYDDLLDRALDGQKGAADRLALTAAFRLSRFRTAETAAVAELWSSRLDKRDARGALPRAMSQRRRRLIEAPIELRQRLDDALDTVDLGSAPFGVEDRVLFARLLSTDCPYSEQLASLQSRYEGGALGTRILAAGEIVGRIAELDATLSPVLSAFGRRMSAPGTYVVEHFGASGFIGEWATTAASLARSADLDAVARACERWRQVLAGAWAYGKAPETWWTRARVLDAVTQHRIDVLLGAENSAREAERRLSAWREGFERVGADHLFDRALSRIAIPRDGRVRDRTSAVARALMDRNVPSIVAPALAVQLVARPRYF